MTKTPATHIPKAVQTPQPHYYGEWLGYFNKQDLQDVYDVIKDIAWGNRPTSVKEKAATAVYVRRSAVYCRRYKAIKEIMEVEEGE
jgi:hypothetical protein